MFFLNFLKANPLKATFLMVVKFFKEASADFMIDLLILLLCQIYKPKRNIATQTNNLPNISDTQPNKHFNDIFVFVIFDFFRCFKARDYNGMVYI